MLRRFNALAMPAPMLRGIASAPHHHAAGAFRFPTALECVAFFGTAIVFTQTCFKQWEQQAATSSKMVQEANSVPLWSPSRTKVLEHPATATVTIRSVSRPGASAATLGDSKR